MVFTFDAELWTWDARQDDGWTFVSLPEEASEQVRELSGAVPRRGFGSLRVKVKIGGSSWSTSIFPDSKLGSYSLPIKKAVRRAEGLGEGDVTTVRVELVDF